MSSNSDKRAAAALALAALLAAGCGSVQVAGDKRVEIGDAYSVEPQIKWSRSMEPNHEIWTVDGLTLQAIHFFKGVRKGRTLSEDRRSDEEWPRFHPNMTPHETMEFVVDSLSRHGLAEIRTHGLQPQAFGAAQGFRFDFDFLYPSGLEGRGMAVGAVIDKKLQLILYVGARDHYYPAYADEVEAIIRSIQPA